MSSSPPSCYEYKFSNVQSWSDNDKADIKRLYTIYFKELGLEFDEKLDPDFVTPEKYFSNELRGAYLTLIYTPPPNSDQEQNNTSSSSSRSQIIGVVGESGSGKSTILNLIPRFYNINDGKKMENMITI